MIDAGHGGHDPGTIGRGGLQEKDLVLDVALRLERLVRQELGAEVVLTRGDRRLHPARGAHGDRELARGRPVPVDPRQREPQPRGPRDRDLLPELRAQPPRRGGRGARERHLAATLKDLQSLVKAITLNSKIDESRDFAAAVQESMVSGVARRSTPCSTAACTRPPSTC